MCLAVISFVLPAGELALVVAEVGPARPDASARPKNRGPSDYGGHLCLTQAMDDNSLQGGPDDDDFRPNPDRAYDVDGQDGALSFLSTLCTSCAEGPCHRGHLLCAGEHRTVVSFTRGCPALCSSVQFLC